MHLVVFSCPLHYHIAQLAIKLACRSYDNIQKVTLVWDDLYSKKHLENLKLVKRLESLDFTVIKHSDLFECQTEPNGWVRQQYIKLNIHHLLNDPEWLLLDGDVVLRTHHTARDCYGRPLFCSEPGSYYRPAVEFTDYALDVITLQGNSFMTPHWLAERSVLESLDNYILEKHQCNLITLFQRFYNTKKLNPRFLPPLTEIEIYGQYATKIMNYHITQKSTLLKCCERVEFLNLWSTTQEDLVLNGRDNFPAEWWATQDIEYQQDLDQALNC